MIESVHDPALQDVFQELMERGERPDAALLEDFTQRYPQFAAEITDFAVEWVLQDELPAEDPETESDETTAVPAALARAQERLAELKTQVPEDATVADPFAGRSPTELKEIAANLGLDKTLIAKLRDRKIESESIPDSLRQSLAGELQVPIEVVAAHLSRPATIYAGTSFKASGKPEVGPKETFTDAVRRSTLKGTAKNRWQTEG